MFRRRTLSLPLPKIVRRFLRDHEGVAAIEFALVAPVLIFAYLGMADITMGLMAARRTSHLAATIGDLASQSDNLTLSNINDLWTIGASMLQPFDTSKGLKMRITEVQMDTTSKTAKFVWSQPTSNWTADDNTTTFPAITTTQLPVGQYMIVTDVEYDYVSPFGQFLKGTTVFSYTFYHHPRNGSQVTHIG